MKTKFFAILLIMLISVIGYSQSYVVQTYKIQSRALKFSTNIPIHSEVIQTDSGIVYDNNTYLIAAGTSVASAISTGKLVKSTRAVSVLRTATLVASGNITGATLGVSGTDTVPTAPLGSLSFKISDSTFYSKIKLTGVKSARWNKITKAK